MIDRKKQIEEAADLREYVWSRSAFVDGAEWADANPDMVEAQSYIDLSRKLKIAVDALGFYRVAADLCRTHGEYALALEKDGGERARKAMDET